jgi:spermidine synthase
MILTFKYGEGLPSAWFMVFGFAVSLACGCQFPAALHLRGGDNPAAVRTFSADLIGAAFGTLATSVVLIPYFGIIWAAAGMIGLKVLSLSTIGMCHEKDR